MNAEFYRLLERFVASQEKLAITIANTHNQRRLEWEYYMMKEEREKDKINGN